MMRVVSVSAPYCQGHDAGAALGVKTWDRPKVSPQCDSTLEQLRQLLAPNWKESNERSLAMKTFYISFFK